MAERIPYRKNPGPSARKVYESQPSRQVDKNFYSSKPWIDSSRAHKAANPLCVPCLAQGFVVPAHAVHHIKERKDFPELALDPTNYESVCRSCHNKKRREKNQRRDTN